MRTIESAIAQFNKIIIYTFFIILSFVVLYPILFCISAAFSPSNQVATMGVLPFSDGFSTKHFVHLFTETEYFHWFGNTLFVSAWTCVLTVIFASLGAYVFSRFSFTFKKPFLLSLLILQIFPSFVGMVAIYVIMNRFKMFDSLWGLILVYVAGNVPYNTWLVKNYMDTISKNLDEAARIDGASHFRTFFTIILPVAKPILIFLAITSFTGPWMDFIFPKIVLRSPENQTLAVGLYSFVTDKKNDFTTFAAGALVVVIPFVIFFLMTQKTLITSFGGAAVKE